MKAFVLGAAMIGAGLVLLGFGLSPVEPWLLVPGGTLLAGGCALILWRMIEAIESGLHA